LQPVVRDRQADRRTQTDISLETEIKIKLQLVVLSLAAGYTIYKPRHKGGNTIMSARKLGGLLLLILGVGGILSVMGVQLGGLIRLVLGTAILYYAVQKWQEERYFLGGFTALLGAVFILGSMHVVVGLLVGAAFIYFGWKLFRSKNCNRGNADRDDLTDDSSASDLYSTKLSDPFDEEWEKQMKTSKI
jgi:predicted membrane protein